MKKYKFRKKAWEKKQVINKIEQKFPVNQIPEAPVILTEEQREKIITEMEGQLKSMPMLIETPRGR